MTDTIKYYGILLLVFIGTKSFLTKLSYGRIFADSYLLLQKPRRGKHKKLIQMFKNSSNTISFLFVWNIVIIVNAFQPVVSNFIGKK